MKCFLAGFFGALLLLIAAVLLSSQYSNYQARAETSEWLAKIKPIQAAIEKNAIQQNSLINAGKDVDKKAFQNADNLRFFEITETSALILQGGRKWAVILIPSLTAGQVTWRCIGGSAQLVPSECADN